MTIILRSHKIKSVSNVKREVMTTSYYMSVLLAWSLNDEEECFCDPDEFLEYINEALECGDTCERAEDTQEPSIDEPLTADTLLGIDEDTTVIFRDANGDYRCHIYVKFHEIHLGQRQFLTSDPELTSTDP